MTSDNDEGHLLYEKGNFSFIDSFAEYKNISADLIPMLEGAYKLYNQHNLQKFFTTYEPPSDHKYMWWLPHQKGFEEWNKMRVILREELFDNVEPISADFDLVTQTLGLLSNEGWQTLIRDFRCIFNFILENYYDYDYERFT